MVGRLPSKQEVAVRFRPPAPLPGGRKSDLAIRQLTLLIMYWYQKEPKPKKPIWPSKEDPGEEDWG